MTQITINGENYTLTANPTHGAVRAVRHAQRSLLSELLKKYKDVVKFDPNQSIDSALAAILAFNPDELVNIRDRDEESNVIATLSLAAGRLFTYEELGSCSEQEYWELFEACKKALGGDSNDFCGRYGGNTSLKTKEPAKMPLKTTLKKP
jgi:hypothetical protein